jgi:DNA-binding PadR family transcriptional regulator
MPGHGHGGHHGPFNWWADFGESFGEWPGRGGPFRGPGGPFRGPGFGRRVDRGDVKYLILSVLEDGPKHGYEIIREVERRAQGAYAPSPGTVYPTLQMLEDMGLVRSLAREERRVYELTDEGRKYVEEHRDEAREAWGRFEHQPWAMFAGLSTDEGRQVQTELAELARALFAQGRIFRADADRLARVRDALKAAREQVDAAFKDYV